MMQIPNLQLKKCALKGFQMFVVQIKDLSNRKEKLSIEHYSILEKYMSFLNKFENFLQKGI